MVYSHMDFIHVVVGIITTICLLTLRYYYIAFNYWKKRNVPQLMPYSLFGNVHSYALQKEHLADIFRHFDHKFNDQKFYGMYFGTKPVLVIRDPDLIKHVLIKDFSSFHDKIWNINEDANPLDANLIFLNGEKWRILRSKLTHAFTSSKIKFMFDLIRECADEMNVNCLDFANEQQEMKIKEILESFTLDVVITCAFGLQRDTMVRHRGIFHQIGLNVSALSSAKSFQKLMHECFPSFANLLRFPLFDYDITGYFQKLIKETVEYRRKHNYVRNDFLQLLINLKNKRIGKTDYTSDKKDVHLQYDESDSDVLNTEFTDDLLAAQCFSFLIAGFETSSTTMGYCIYELAMNPDIQNKLREEIDSVLGLHGGKLTYEAIQSMEYLSRVLDETLRKYPVVISISRSCTKPYVIPDTNLKVDKGIHIHIPVYAIHHDSEYYPDPEKFDPERFTDDSKRYRHQCVYLPFGEGPRMCIGMRFGQLQTKVGLANLISKYEFSPCSKTKGNIKVDPKSRFISTSEGDIWLKVSSRDSTN